MALGCRVWDHDRSESTIPGQYWNKESRSLVKSTSLQPNKVQVGRDTETLAEGQKQNGKRLSESKNITKG